MNVVLLRSRFGGNPHLHHCACKIKIVKQTMNRSHSHQNTCMKKGKPSTLSQSRALAHPYQLNQQAIYNRIGIEVAEQDRPENSRIVIKRIEHEWTDYCMHVDEHSTFPFQMTATKVYNFMFYQLFRPKKSGLSRSIGFDCDEYERVLAEYSVHLENNRLTGTPIPHPPEGVGKSSLQQYRAFLRKIHACHVAENLTSTPWELVFTEPCRNLIKIGDGRKMKQDKENYKEKVDKVFGPYQAVERMDELESEMWNKSKNLKGAGCWFRN